MHAVTGAELDQILSLIDSGKNAHQISSATGHHTSTITRLWSKHHPDLPKPSGGRPTKLSPTNIHYATQLISPGKVDTCIQVTHALQTLTQEPLSHETVHLKLKQAGWKAVVKKKHPRLTRTHKREQLDFAISHQEWTLEDWKRVIWSDETKINCIGSDGQKWLWNKANEGLSDQLVQGTQKHGGGSMMMWGCMSWKGIGWACKIDGKMDAELYCDILEDELQGSLEEFGKQAKDVIFQHDNDPKHTSNLAKNWLKDHGFDVMLCALLSPQTSIQLNICGLTSRGSLQSMKNHLKAFTSCGSRFRWNGVIYQQAVVRI
jgi:transposase